MNAKESAIRRVKAQIFEDTTPAEKEKALLSAGVGPERRFKLHTTEVLQSLIVVCTTKLNFPRLASGSTFQRFKRKSRLQP